MKRNSFQDIFENQLKKGDEVVFRYLENGDHETESLTFIELGEAVNTYASFLQQHFEIDDRVILLLPNNLEFVKVILAGINMGIISIPLHPINNKKTFEKCQYVLKDAKASAILSTRKIYQYVHRKYAHEIEDWEWIFIDDIDKEKYTDFKKTSFSSNKIAFLQYTSGSTNNPKGVCVTNQSLLSNLKSIKESMSIQKGDKIVSWLPFSHDMGIMMIFETIFSGIECILFPPMIFVQSPIKWLKVISKYKASLSGAPNFAYELCAEKITPKEKEKLDLSSWKIAFCGAEPVKVATYLEFYETFEENHFSQSTFTPCYGMAEATLMISGVKRGELPKILHLDKDQLLNNQVVEVKNGTPVISCGTVIKDHELRIVNPNTLQECNDQEIGEIWFSGNSVAHGYWDRDDSTAFKSKLKGSETYFLRTGDLGFLSDSELYVTGRLKELIIINGLNYYPKDIEQHIETKVAGLKKNCTAAFQFLENQNGELGFIAELQRTVIRDINLEELAHSIRSIISNDFGLNVFFVGLLSTGRLPKTTSGKIQRKLYAQLIDQKEIEFLFEWDKRSNNRRDLESAVKKRTNQKEFQQWLLKKVSTAFQINESEINTDTALNNYGMDSVTAVSLSGEIATYLGQDVSPTLFYDFPSIEKLSNKLFENESSDQADGNIEHSQDKKSNDIAIIGIGVNFPKSNSLDEFWEHLESNISLISELSDDRIALHDHCSPGGYLADLASFDARFFNISSKEAKQMDPQHRILLQTSYHAIENAHLNLEKIKGSNTGVFIGIGNNDYHKLFNQNASSVNAYSGIGGASSIAANRLSYVYDLQGPSLSIDTACSSSLVATHLGVQSLMSGESDMALVGGVNLILDNTLETIFGQAGMLSPDYQCKTFDSAANGYVRGEGCGIVLIKRLEDALKDGNEIHAIIKGSAINQDGATNGITAPNGLSQKRVIRQALKNSNIHFDELSYIEAHGTGTSLGDPIEVNTLSELAKNNKTPCYLGSIKANLGHTEFAAGIVGLIKVVLCLKNKKILGNINLQTLNPLIEIDPSKLVIHQSTVDWKSHETTRKAGVSSFGFGGTNAHVILEEYQKPENNLEKSEQPRINVLTLSAKSKESLSQLKKKYINFLKSNAYSLNDVCHSSNHSRTHFKNRFSVTGASSKALIDQLNTADSTKKIANKKHMAFLYTGQGSQYINMGKSLYEMIPFYREHVDFCANWLLETYQFDLMDILYNEERAADLNKTSNSQLAIFVIEYSLSKLLIRIGVEPTVLLGHSIGEYAAACISGVFSIEDALKLVYHRSKLMYAATGDGTMYGVFENYNSIQEIIKPFSDVSIAAQNSPGQVVISGSKSSLLSVNKILTEKEIRYVELNVSHAFHSIQMQSASEKFKEIADSVTYHLPEIPVFSTVTASFVDEELTKATYWTQQILETVQFSESIEKLQNNGVINFAEIGSSPILTPLLHQICVDKDITTIYCLRKHKGIDTFSKAVAQFYELGYNIDWEIVNPIPANSIPLPLYPFQKSTYWLSKPKFRNEDAVSFDEFLSEIENDENFSPQEKDVIEKLKKSFEENFTKKKRQSIPKLHRKSWKRDEEFTHHPGTAKTQNCLLIGNSVDTLLVDAIKANHIQVKYVSYDSLTSGTAISQDIFQNIEDQLNEHQINTNGPFNIVIAFTENLERDVSEISIWSEKLMMFLAAISSWLENHRSSCIIFTKNAISEIEQQSNSSFQILNSMLWGAAKNLSVDHPQYFNGIVNYDDSFKETTFFDAIVKDAFTQMGEQFVNYHMGDRYVYRLDEVPLKPIEKENFSSAGTYVISGGMGSIGMLVGEMLAENGAKELILLTRKPKEYYAGDKRLERFKNKATQVHIESCDVRSKVDIERLHKKLSSKNISVNGIIHAAGSLGIHKPQEIQTQDVHDVLDTKMMGAIHLYNQFAIKDLEFFVSFSSIASVWGSSQQLLYCTANHFLDSFSNQLRQDGKKAFSINWGPWESSSMLNDKFRNTLELVGIKTLNPEEALSTLKMIMIHDIPDPIVVDVDWLRLSEVYSMSGLDSIFEFLNGENDDTHSLEEQRKVFLEEMSKLGHYPAMKAKITTLLHDMAYEILEYDSDEQLSLETGFFELGFDSILALDFTKRIQLRIGVKLPNTLLFEHSDINELSRHLLEALGLGEVQQEEKNNKNQLLEDLSEESLRTLLEEELNRK